MKLIDIYNDYKKDYKDYVLIINSGIFSYIYNIDIGIICSLFKYKINRKANYYIIGFPNNNLVKVLEVLKSNNINNLVFDKNSNDKYKDKNNNYNKFLIDMSRIDYLNKRIYYLREKYHIDIPIYVKDKGLSIGIMSRRVIACFYLDEFDKMILNDLKIKEYIRYMDDGVLFHYDKEYLKYSIKK